MQFPQAGQTFQGKYQLLEVLGRGGFAAVYKAVDTEIGREVAIKLLTPGEDGYDPSTVARFQREARVIAQLKDPHTITMFDYGRTDDDLLFMVFEYVAGKDLSHRLGETGPLPPAIVVHVLDQLLHALREAHEAGVLHRDIKPANVLVFPYLDDDWRVKLLDFGIAKPGVGRNANPVATLTQAGGIIGTPRYMSPEQLCGENLSPSSDIYSLGLLAYEMLVGSPAISGRDTRDNIVLQLSTEPLVLPPQAPVPAQLRRVIERMMAREAGDRFQSAREVIAALRGPDASGPQTGPFGSIPTPNRPGHSPFQGLAGSSSGELRHYTTPRTGPVQAPTKDRSLSPLATLGIGAALGAAIVIPAMMIALQNDNDVAEPPRVNKALTKQVSDHPPVHEPPVVEPSTDSGTAADTVVEEAPSGCGKPAQETGFLARKADFGFGGRGVVTYLPKTYEPNRRYPLVMVFHDRTRDPRQAIEDMKLAQFADSEGFIVVAPGGRSYNAPWDPPGDLDFLRDVLDQTEKSFCVDETLRYGIAHNKGAEALEAFACFVEFSAIATTAYRGGDHLVCDYSPPVPHIHLVGNKDRYHPLQGGSTCDLGSVVPLERKEGLWRDQNGCTGKRKPFLKVDTGVCETFGDCDAAFVSCITDGGRDWPGSAARGIQLPNCIVGPSEFPITETIWKFFVDHGRPINVEE